MTKSLLAIVFFASICQVVSSVLSLYLTYLNRHWRAAMEERFLTQVKIFAKQASIAEAAVEHRLVALEKAVLGSGGA